MDQRKIGAFIASLRKEQGLTQTQFAERLGVTNKAVSKWETGRGLPDASLYGEICGQLGITLNEFFAGERIAEENLIKKADETLLGVVTEYQRRRHRTAAIVLQCVRVVLLAALAVSLLFCVDLGLNYAYNLLYEYHDGVTIYGALSALLYGDDGWYLPSFFESFRRAAGMSAVLAVANIVLQCVVIVKDVMERK